MERPASIDMLVPLLAMPPVAPLRERLRGQGIEVRRAKVWEASLLRDFIVEHLFPPWAEEAAVAFSNKPISAFLAFDGVRTVGFAAYECTYRGVFGPIGVDAPYRERGIATALLLESLASMREMGYIYAIIGQAGPRRFFEKACGALAVPEDWPKYVGDG
ncbi:MAG: GNAT family N-acetyltransferase [Dehalococcoidia bacterium]|nr:GNAT family N-acetyltransferase [Dehalococcoidia bacterium]